MEECVDEEFLLFHAGFLHLLGTTLERQMDVSTLPDGL